MKLDQIDNLIKYLNNNTNKVGDCWIYKINIVDGYGKIKISGKAYGVHCLSAYLYLGFDLQSKFQINHKVECTSRACWNPEHLYIGTQYQNCQDTRDVENYYNQQKTHCSKGHLLDGRTKGPSTNFRINRYCKTCRSNYKKERRGKASEAISS